MNKINFFYDKSSKLFFYDNTLNDSIFFENELSSQKKYLINNSRYLISSNSLSTKNPIYISSIEKYNVEDGIVLNIHNSSILLIPVGKNIYLLAAMESYKTFYYSILYTFMIDNSCVIDVSKFAHLFKKCNFKLNTFKEIKLTHN